MNAVGETLVAKPRPPRGVVLDRHEVEGVLRRNQTQIRRIAKFPDRDDWGDPISIGVGHPAVADDDGIIDAGDPIFAAWFEECSVEAPLGPVGRELWVQETWSTDGARDIYPCPGTWYRADFCDWEDPSRKENLPRENEVYRWKCTSCKSPNSTQCLICWKLEYGFAWRPPILLPRERARISLVVTDIRAHRLQEITEEDAKAQGVTAPVCNRLGPSFGTCDYVAAFKSQWEARYGHTASCSRTGRCRCATNPILQSARWDANPWVWAYTVRRVR